ncbi:MAG: 6-phosphofructokinase, partial [Chloroflexota bacterium]
PAVCQRIADGLARGKRSSIVVVAEGAAGGAFKLAQQVAQCVESMAETDVRVCVLGHIQRGGAPSAADRLLGSILGDAAVAALLAGYTCHMVGRVRGETVLTPLERAISDSKDLPEELLALIQRLSA